MGFPCHFSLMNGGFYKSDTKFKEFLYTIPLCYNSIKKKIGQWMHGSREKLKMAEGDGGRFLGNRALQLVKISWECYHYPYAFPHKTNF